MKKSNIYTATGDNGSTSLVGGKRVKKNDPRLEAYGTVDELNSILGFLATSHGMQPDQVSFIQYVQHKLFNIGAYLATDNPDDDLTECQGLGPDAIQRIERQIDSVDILLPPLRDFVIPGGAHMAALTHVARTVCRRCERRVVDLADTTHVDPQILIFLNRLSDYLFVLARLANVNYQLEELFWDKDC